MEKNTLRENYSLSKDMKYEALYWALGFKEEKSGIFKKKYPSIELTIDADKKEATFDDKITILSSNHLNLTTHKSFVILECVDKLLSMGYYPCEIIISLINEYDIYCSDLYIKCFEWNHEEQEKVKIKKKSYKSIVYSSRLVSGIIERRSIITDHTGVYQLGIFDLLSRKEEYDLSNPLEIKSDKLLIEGTIVKKCICDDKIISIPEGITDLASCLFWDNQSIEEVILPDSLINIGGDTFYNCGNLKKIIIPKRVREMGNNPFAGCPKLVLKNYSPFFHYENDVLYNQDYSRLIYCSILKKENEYSINKTTHIIGKHSFYLCNTLKKIIIPESVIKMENNPFSGCNKLNIENHSNKYHIINKVIYDEKKESVIGCLNSIQDDDLILLPIKRICRNSFWNCTGIKKIVLPNTLEQIGYNPFAGCSNIEFVSFSNNYIVYHDALYSKDKSKLICYPSKSAVNEVFLPDQTRILERGAFSGCNMMTNIHLHNVSIISKSCFTNCNLLTKVYCSDLVSYVGEWAFAHCNHLKKISVFNECVIDNNATKNSPTEIQKRTDKSNYVIESDNMYTLLSLQETYKEKIKSILIDPPYHSHILNLGYEDCSFEQGYYEFMNQRIRAAYELLSNDGFMVINIDKGELRNIVNVCKRYFNKNVNVYKWEKIHSFFDKNRKVEFNKKKVKYEYIVLCRKTTKARLNHIRQPFIKNNELFEKDAKLPRILRCFGTNSSAKDEMKEIFGNRDYFKTPKPMKLMKELIRATTDKDSIVLDFFAGSGTVGHATVDLNKEDNGTRKYLLVCNNESNICRNVTLKRMKMFDDDVVFID